MERPGRARSQHADLEVRRLRPAEWGAFLRLAFAKRLWLLIEHDVTERTTDEAERFVHLAGHSQLFYLPVDWFKTSLTAEHLTTRAGSATYRFPPALQVRLTPNIKVQLEIQESYPQPRARALAFEFQLQTQ